MKRSQIRFKLQNCKNLIPHKTSGSTILMGFYFDRNVCLIWMYPSAVSRYLTTETLLSDNLYREVPRYFPEVTTTTQHVYWSLYPNYYVLVQPGGPNYTGNHPSNQGVWITELLPELSFEKCTIKRQFAVNYTICYYCHCQNFALCFHLQIRDQRKTWPVFNSS